MPRTLGARHVLVNVPAFTAALIDDGHVTARHRAVVGAVRTPTPQLSARSPRSPSIPGGTCRRASSAPPASARGYEVTRGANGGGQRPPAAGAAQRARPGEDRDAQPARHLSARHAVPGPVRPGGARLQPWLHPHPERPRFRRLAARADRPLGPRATSTTRSIRAATRRPPLAHPVPVYIAYFTAAATTDGNIVTYSDIYGRDAPVRVALNRAAARPTHPGRPPAVASAGN